MCGICGYIHLDRSKNASEDILKSMASTLSRRGPDDTGTYIKNNIALGHKRLSIIDLRTGHQPMSCSDGSMWAVYNGEIYNFKEMRSVLQARGHVFRTNSDTEVLLASYKEYGEDCLKHFNGMFAFAVWDSAKETLFLARDRFGKKPLYYACLDNQFIFASELKAVLKHPSVKKEIDLDGLKKYFSYEYIPAPYTIFKNIKKLEAASKISVRGYRQSSPEAYWDIDLNRKNQYTVIETKEKLFDLFRESVRKRLISDVPLGVFLSGGIDSSSVVAMMSDLMKPKDIKTFSIGFKESGYDESEDSRLVASYFGTDHREEILDQSVMIEVLPEILDYMDEPFADSSIIPTYLVSRFTRKHVTVALGGDGGDELFAGYPSFKAHKLDYYLRIVPDFLKAKPLEITASLMPASKTKSYIQRFAKGLSFPESLRHQVWIGAFTPSAQKELFSKSNSAGLLNKDVYNLTQKFFEKARTLDVLDRAAYIYMKMYMTDDILAKVDRASMANSLEVRAPFLDKDFVEFAFTIPSELKMRGFSQKWILKRAMEKKLPPEIFKKPKHGFAVPVARWLRADLKGLLLEAFDKKKIEREGIFDYNYINSLIAQFLKNDDKGLTKEVWSLFMFELWHDRWMG